MKVLVTCPPMLGIQEKFKPLFADKNIEVHCPKIVQTLSESELIELLPEFDGWIIGDDPATRRVFEAGIKGKLKAAVKWGVGVDNVDFAACRDLNLPITNTPGMFGREVADVATGYVLALARETFVIDRGVREGGWPKPRGMSLWDKTVGIVGFGDIGRNVAKRLLASDMQVIAYDPAFKIAEGLEQVDGAVWPQRVEECDFLVFTCSLNQANRHMLNADTLARCKAGVRIVNVARGPLIDEKALEQALQFGHVHSAALDVFEVEPLPMESVLRAHPRCIFGSHNGSNTNEAVWATTQKASQLLFGFLGK